MKHIWKLEDYFCRKGEKCDEIAKGHFKKITENAHWEPPRKAAYSEHSIAIHSISKAGHCNRRTGYCPLRAPCPGGEQFLWVLKNDLLRFHLILFFFDLRKRKKFQMCLVRSIIANLCPIMTYFNALDFNVRRSEEVISFFWRSVYILESFNLLAKVGTVDLWISFVFM